jgi:hypothetical protein
MQMAYSYSTNDLWLEITGVANGVAYFVIHTPDSEPYDLFMTTNLTAQGLGLNLTNWLRVAGAASGVTNLSHWIETNSIAFYRLGTTNDADDEKRQ